MFSSDFGRRGTGGGSEQPSASTAGGKKSMGGSSKVPMGRLGSQWGGRGERPLD